MIRSRKFLLVFILISAWIFSGFPQIWQNPRIPPKIQEARAADISIDTGAAGQWRGMRSLVWTTPLIGYFFYIDGGDSDFKYVKTLDGGQTWNAGAEIDDDTTITGMIFDVWYDRWTPGDTGNLIHIWWVETADGDVNYVNLNTTNDSIGSNVIVFNGTSAVAERGVFVSGAKARGGNMLVAFDIDAGAEMGTYRSTDGGANWGARTNMVEATVDQLLMFPGNETDTQDMWALYHDASADALTLKMHDDSANTNPESSSIATLVEQTTDGTGQYGFSGSIRKSDGHLIAATESEYDSATGDFQVWDINGTGSITQKTAIATDKDDIYYPSVHIDSVDNIYVAYIGKRDGSETLGTTNGVYYTKSTDGGANWSAGDTAYSATASDWRHIWAAPSGPRFMVVWRDISAASLMENYDNSVIATAALTGTVTASITETDIVAGGKTIILTLSGDNWVASGATFDAQRQNIINGLDSAQSEANGWDAEVKAKEVVGAVVRTSATVVTITLTAASAYNITATETITATIPATAVLGANGAITANPTFTVIIPPADLTWATGAADFEIWQSGSLTWDAGTLICSGTLTDTNADTISCSSGSVANSTQYRVQVVLKNVGGTVINMQGAAEYVDHVAVKGGWTGTNPTLGSCGFRDFDLDNGPDIICSIAWNATNDVRITNSGSFPITIAATGGTEGFMYLITTDSDAPSSNSTSYMNTSIDSISEDSSKITISGPGGAPVYSVAITPAGDIEYGFVSLSVATTTIGSTYTKTATNDGTATEKLNVKSSDAAGGTGWTLASSIGTNQFKHEFSTTTGAVWTTMPDSATYVTAKPSVAVSGTATFDFRLTAPSLSSDYQQKSITITVQAVAP